MKYIWEPADIVSGQHYGGKGKEVWLIGYLAGRNKNTIVSISLIDGMVVDNSHSPEKFAEMLNREGYIPFSREKA